MANTHHLIGTGPHKVIALHGWFGDRHAFAPMEPLLTGSEFSYAFMDYRGYGGMKDVDGAFTMDEIAADTLALADALGWREFSLIGHSMGGMAIQRVLTRAPSRVKKLVAIDAGAGLGLPVRRRGLGTLLGRRGRMRPTATPSSTSPPATVCRRRGSTRWSPIRSRFQRRRPLRGLSDRVGEDRFQRRGEGTAASGARDHRRARPGDHRRCDEGDLPRVVSERDDGSDGVMPGTCRCTKRRWHWRLRSSDFFAPNSCSR